MSQKSDFTQQHDVFLSLWKPFMTRAQLTNHSVKYQDYYASHYQSVNMLSPKNQNKSNAWVYQESRITCDKQGVTTYHLHADRYSCFKYFMLSCTLTRCAWVAYCVDLESPSVDWYVAILLFLYLLHSTRTSQWCYHSSRIKTLLPPMAIVIIAD